MAVVPFKDIFGGEGITLRLEILTDIRNRMRNTKSVFVMCGHGGLLSNPNLLPGDSGLEECWEEGAEDGISFPSTQSWHSCWIHLPGSSLAVYPWIILSVPPLFLTFWPLLHQQLRKLPGI